MNAVGNGEGVVKQFLGQEPRLSGFLSVTRLISDVP